MMTSSLDAINPKGGEFIPRPKTVLPENDIFGAGAIADHAARIDKIASDVGNIEQRLSALEQRLPMQAGVDIPSPSELHPILVGTADATKRVMAGLPQHEQHDDIVYKDAVYTRDWFPERRAWDHFFATERNNVREYLEIGVFEGRSLLHAAHIFPNAALTCIDTFEGGGAHHPHLEELFAKLEDRFLHNIKPIRERVKVLKGTSVKRLAELSDAAEVFDVIYIDGSHFYRHVMLDTLMAWPLLKVRGVLVWDDYDFAQAQYGNKVPKLAANQFLDAYAGDYEVVFVTNQVAIRKTRSEPPID